MPIPTPRTGESQSDFMARFMSNSTMKTEYPDQKQRLAVAYSKWKKKKLSKELNDLKFKK